MVDLSTEIGKWLEGWSRTKH